MFVSDMEKGFQNVNAPVIDLESLSRVQRCVHALAMTI